MCNDRRRSRIPLLSLFLLFTLQVLAACSPGSPGASRGRDDDLPVTAGCARDQAALERLDADPRVCVVTSECPAGASCTDGMCTWECLADSDCGSEASCSCDGVCAPGRAGEARRRDVCEPDEALLLELATPEGERTCGFNDDCPDGAYCDPINRTCAWDCLPSGQAGSVCAAGKSCDCYGQCTSSGANPGAAVDPLRQRPRLEVSRGLFELGRVGDPASVPTQVTVDVRLVAASQQVATQNAAAVVRVKAGPEVEVSCDGQTFAPECAVSSWAFTAQGTSFAARATVAMRLTATTSSVRTGWLVTVGSDDTLNRRRTLSLRLPAGITPTGGVAFEGEYVGAVSIVGAAVRDDDTLEGPNLVADPGFENQWARQPVGWPWMGEGASGAAGIDRPADGLPYGRGGGANGFVYLQWGWAALAQTINVTPHTDYRYSVWLQTGPQIHDGYIGVRDAAGQQFVNRKFEVLGPYQEHVIDFNSGPRTQVAIFAGTWGPGTPDWIHVDDASVRKRVPGAARLGARSIAVTAIARNNTLVLIDPTRQIASSGRIVLPWAQDHAYDDTWLTGAAIPGDTAADSGAFTARISQAGADAQHLPGVLRGRFSVKLPTSLADSTVAHDFDLRRVGDVSRSSCALGCDASSTCDPRVGLCLPGGTWQAPAQPGNTLSHTLAVRWRDAARTLFESARPLYRNFWREPYGIAANRDRSYGRFVKADQVGIEKVAPVDGFELCSYFGSTFAYMSLQPAGKLPDGCWAEDDGLPAGQAIPRVASTYCEKLYQRSRYLASSMTPWGPICTRLAPDAGATAALKKTHVPCLRDQTGEYVHAGADYSCNLIYQRAIQDRWRDWNSFIDGECVKLEENVVDYWGNHQPLYLCPFQEATWGTAGDVMAERLACFDPLNTGNAGAFASGHFTNELAPVSGDLKCTSPGTSSPVQKTVELYSAADAATPTTPKVRELLDGCLADLSQSPPSPGSAPTMTPDFKGFFPRRSCISLARFMVSVYERDPAPHGYLLRLLQQWLGVHSFVAKVGLGKWRDDSMIAGTNGTSTRKDLAALEPLLAQLDKGWDLILDPVIGTRLGDVHVYHVAEDYRVNYAWNEVSTPKKEHEAATHFHVSLLAATKGYLEVVEAYADQAAVETYAACRGEADGTAREVALARLGTSLRYITAVEALALRLRERAASWEDMSNEKSWRQVERELAVARARLATKATGIERCDNPLNIPDGEVLLFFDDLIGPKARFFATSDYLAPFALAQVTSAKTLLTDARQSWTNAYESAIQAARSNADNDRILEGLLRQYGEPIKKACGLTMATRDVVAAFDPKLGTHRPELCFVRTEDPTCAVSNPPDRCLRGELGQALLTIRQAQKDVQIARLSVEDHMERYDRQVKYCTNLQAELREDVRLVKAHTEEMLGFAMQRQHLEEDELLLEVGQGIVSGMIGMASGNPAAAGGMLTTLFGSQLKSKAHALTLHVEQAKLRHQEAMAARAAHREAEKCFHEAELIKIGIDTGTEQIQARLLGATSAILTFDNLMTQVQQYAIEGPAALERERGRLVSSLANHYFVDEKVAEFQRVFALARWYTYLELVAVEHDTQQRLGLRGKVIGAAHPDELKAVLDACDVVRLPKKIFPWTLRPGDPIPEGHAPLEHSVILSLRDQVLGLYDFTTVLPGGEDPDFERMRRTATAVERLQERLWDPAYAVYDDQGQYLGQGIPFDMPVVGVLEERCAERLWRINATIQGEVGFPQQPAVENFPLKVLQRNTFASQACHRGATDAQFVGGHVGTTEQAWGQTPALVHAWRNVPRNDFDKLPYVIGATEELAGRGLYGQYVLLFPWNGLLAEGFPLDKVEDVILRFDLLSVDDGQW